MPNAQLRALNPRVDSTLRGVSCALPVQLAGLAFEAQVGGVSSFGYSGTIAHAVLRHAMGTCNGRCSPTGPAPTCRRSAFPWCSAGQAFLPSCESLIAMYGVCWMPLTEALEPVYSPYAVLALTCCKGMLKERSIHESGDQGKRVPVALWYAAIVLLPHAEAASSSRLAGLSTVLTLVHVEQRPRLILVSSGVVLSRVGGALGTGVADGAIRGFARTVRLEQPSLEARNVDIGLVATSFVGGVGAQIEMELALNAEMSFGARLRLCVGTPLPSTRIFGTWTVTGGLGSLGLRSAYHIVETGASTVCLCSRSGRVASECRDLHTALASFCTMRSASAVRCRCDVSTRVEAVIATRAHSNHGVVHASGVLDDLLLRRMTAKHLTSAFTPKAIAAAHLHAASPAHLFSAFVFLSSIAALLGNVGQANYAAANSCLDGLVQYRSSVAAEACSLQLLLVAGSTMATGICAQRAPCLLYTSPSPRDS